VTARETGSAALLNFGFSAFETVSIRRAGETVLKPRVYKGAEPYVALATHSAVDVTVPRGQGIAVTTRTLLRRPLIAPLPAGTSVGELQVDIGGKTVARAALYPVTAMPAGGWWRRLVDTVSLWF
jgi:D-alanyl-D-alanine carboxypeptidase (penicillin-binding protein 5/6)